MIKYVIFIVLTATVLLWYFVEIEMATVPYITGFIPKLQLFILLHWDSLVSCVSLWSTPCVHGMAALLVSSISPGFGNALVGIKYESFITCVNIMQLWVLLLNKG